MNGTPPALSSSRWGSRTKRVVVLICLVCVGFAILNLLEIFPILIISTLLSYLLWPLAIFIERRILPPPLSSRSLAVFLAFFSVIILIIFVIIIIVPALVSQLADIGRSLPETVATIEANLESSLNRPLRILGRTIIVDGQPLIPMERLRELTGTQSTTDLIQPENVDVFGTVRGILGSVGSLTGPAFSVLGGFFTTLFNFVFLIVITFYLMRDGDRFATRAVQITPEAYRGDVARMLYELGKVWNAYLRGQLILCSTVGLMVYIAALLLGLPNAPILGLMAGILEFIPNIGPFIALVPAFLLALFSQSTTLPFLEGLPYALVAAVTWTGIQNIEAFYIVPRVMGGSLDLHPVVVIFGVIAGASLAGPLGIILAAPFLATIRLIGLYLYGKLFDVDPFPTPKKNPLPPPPGTSERILADVRRYLAQIQAAVWRRLPAGLKNRFASFNRRVSSGPVLPSSNVDAPEKEVIS